MRIVKDPLVNRKLFVDSLTTKSGWRKSADVADYDVRGGSTGNPNPSPIKVDGTREDPGKRSIVKPLASVYLP